MESLSKRLTKRTPKIGVKKMTRMIRVGIGATTTRKKIYMPSMGSKSKTVFFTSQMAQCRSCREGWIKTRTSAN